MKRIFFCMIIASGLVACGDDNATGSPGYVDSSNATPSSTVNPPDGTSTGLDTTSRMGDTTLMGRDTGVGGAGRDTTRQ